MRLRWKWRSRIPPFHRIGLEANMRRARRSRVASVTLDDLREHFHVPLQAAAASLQISETMVKRVARKFGIKKWPYRQVRVRRHG